MKMNKLKWYRQKRDLSQSQLAKLSGVPIRTIKSYEQELRDINKASAIVVYKLAFALKCNTEDLLNL